MIKALAVSLGWFLLGTCPCHAQPAKLQEPVQVVQTFYTTYLKLGVSGLPNRHQAGVLAPFLSPDLNRLLVSARKQQATDKKRHPDDKPRWDDGDLFSSLSEGAQTFRVGTPAAAADHTEVPVKLEYRDGKTVTRWKDTFVVVSIEGSSKISDVKMGGKWAFKQGSSLRGILKANQ